MAADEIIASPPPDVARWVRRERLREIRRLLRARLAETERDLAAVERAIPDVLEERDDLVRLARTRDAAFDTREGESLDALRARIATSLAPSTRGEDDVEGDYGRGVIAGLAAS